MSDCDFCGKKIGGFPHKCKYCGQVHCSEHLQPESHECLGLEFRKQKNAERWKETIVNSFGGRYTKNSQKEEKDEDKMEEPVESLNIKQNHKPKPYNKKPPKNLKFSEKLKEYGIEKYDEIKYWLMKRERQRYAYQERSTYLITTILIFATALVATTIFYSNASKLNEVSLWIINLGGVLILTSLFFAIKFGWRLFKEIINIFKRQRNWFRGLVILLIVILLWQGYTHKYSVLNPVFEAYNKTNFTVLAPVTLNGLILDSSSNPSYTKSNNNKGNSGFKEFVNGVLDPKSQIDISELEQRVHTLINKERTNQGLKPLTWDDKIGLIAREHSQDMATNNFFSHDNLNGEDPTDRGKRHGYSCVKDYGAYYTSGLAENIALTPIYSDVVGCGSTTSLDSLAECIVEGWMTSPGHRENILTGTYTKAGVGIAYSEDNQAYSTQDFC